MKLSALQELKDRLKAAEDDKTYTPPVPAMDEGGREGRAHGVRLVDLGRPVLINQNSGPLEFLVSRGELETNLDQDGMGGARFHVALRFRDLMQGAQVKGLQSPNMGGVGGGGPSTDIRAYQLDCMRLIGEVRAGMPKPWLFDVLERVVWLDDWLDLWPEWEPRPASRTRKLKERMRTLKALHYALDIAGRALGYIGEEEFRRRWKASQPSPSAQVRRRILVSRA